MARYIEATDVINILSLFYNYRTDVERYDLALAISAVPTADVVDKERYDRLLENATIIAEALNKYQTADMVEVAWCKDCKHRDKYECNHIVLGGTKCGVTDDWFCADGERREDAKLQSNIE